MGIGNLTRKQTANGLVADYKYDERNLFTEELKTRAGDVMRRKMAYDKGGNLVAASDARGNVTLLSYHNDGQLNKQAYYRAGANASLNPDLAELTDDILKSNYSLEESLVYTYYPESGLLQKVEDGAGSVEYMYTIQNQISSETRSILDGTATRYYTTAYQYDFMGNLTGMRYPDSTSWITYGYDGLNRLRAVGRFSGIFDKEVLLKSVQYDLAGNMTEMEYNNGVVTTLKQDKLGRPSQITVTSPLAEKLLDLNYAYDPTGNVTARNNNHYTYDVLDRLESAMIEGTFVVDTPSETGYAANDYFTNAVLDYALENVEVSFDYAASTLGLKFASTEKVGRIEIIPGSTVQSRVGKDGLSLFYRSYDGTFKELLKTQWELDRGSTDKIILTLKTTIETTEMKIHANYDDRNVEGEVVNEATVKGRLKEIVRVYGRYDRTKITYGYDEAGNRLSESYTDFNNGSTVTYSYNYYNGSDRLKTRSSVDTSTAIAALNGSYLDGLYRFGAGEQMGYKYDRAGNLIEKGNRYTQYGDNLVFGTTVQQGEVRWKYEYNSRNRLTTVWKNGASDPLANYQYDFSGKRVLVRENGKATHYVYNYMGQLLYENHVTEKMQVSYIYALGRPLVKVAGKIAKDAELSYYHQDNLGSTMLMTDKAGAEVFKQDYAPFGQTLYAPGTNSEPAQKVQTALKFTGQLEDADTGLYYYNARYYDPETGRFTREDEYQGELVRPQTLNLYVYTLNNPLKYIDPTGHYSENAAEFTYDDAGIFVVRQDNKVDTVSSAAAKPETLSDKLLNQRTLLDDLLEYQEKRAKEEFLQIVEKYRKMRPLTPELLEQACIQTGLSPEEIIARYEQNIMHYAKIEYESLQMVVGFSSSVTVVGQYTSLSSLAGSNSKNLGISKVTGATQGHVIFGMLDDLGRPTGMTATRTKESIKVNGSRASQRIIPPGLKSSDDFAEGHLLAKQLGGTGNDPRNLIAIYQNPVNTPIMSRFESSIRRAVEMGEVVRYNVVPLYRGNELVPYAIKLQANGTSGFNLETVIFNNKVGK